MHILAALRDAKWIAQDRVQGYSIILLSLCMLLIVFFWYERTFVMSTAPAGGDFISFQAAAKLASEGQPQAAYNPKTQHSSERQLLSGHDIPYFSFFYPPPFLLICFPFAFLPHPAATALWLLLTGGPYWRMLRGFLPQRRAILPILAFPAFFVNISYGQNGFLSGALLGFGALLLSERPILAGLCFGSLIYKPHLGILIPITLAAARAWRAFLAAGAMALVLLGLSWAVFGTETWEAFFSSNHLAREALEQNLIGYEKMQSLFAFLRLAGQDVSLAYTAQALGGLAACGAVVWLACRVPAGPALGAALAAATLLTSPFLLAYDLTILGVPIAWLTAEGVSKGFRPWEKIVLLSAYLLPGIAWINLFTRLLIPWTPIVVSLVLFAVLRRASEKQFLPLVETDVGPAFGRTDAMEKADAAGIA